VRGTKKEAPQNPVQKIAIAHVRVRDFVANQNLKIPFYEGEKRATIHHEENEPSTNLVQKIAMPITH
jgi:hypothetical protein